MSAVMRQRILDMEEVRIGGLDWELERIETNESKQEETSPLESGGQVADRAGWSGTRR